MTETFTVFWMFSFVTWRFWHKNSPPCWVWEGVRNMLSLISCELCYCEKGKKETPKPTSQPWSYMGHLHKKHAQKMKKHLQGLHWSFLSSRTHWQFFQWLQGYFSLNYEGLDNPLSVSQQFNQLQFHPCNSLSLVLLGGGFPAVIIHVVISSVPCPK